MEIKKNCGFFVPQLLLIYLQSSQLLFWWLFALLGSAGGQGRGMDYKFMQNNHKEQKITSIWLFVLLWKTA